jgi:transcriptional regulator with XRE-family HTH domain
MTDFDPTLRPRFPEQTVRVGAQFRQERLAIGWSLKYAAARIGITTDYLQDIERGTPIPKSQYTRILRIYSRTMYKLTNGMARTMRPGRFQ